MEYLTLIIAFKAMYKDIARDPGFLLQVLVIIMALALRFWYSNRSVDHDR